MPRVLISAMESGLDAAVDPRLGKCRYLVFVDPETMAFEAVENPYLLSWGEDAAVRTAQSLRGKGVQAVVTGPCGAETQEALAASRIQLYEEVEGTVEELVHKFNEGELKLAVPVAGRLGRVRVALGALREQAKALSRQADELARRIEELEKKVG